MKSKILDTIGMGDVDIAIFIIIILVIGIAAIAYCIVLTNKLKKLTKRYEAFMTGKNGKSLEETFVKKFEDIEFLLKENKIKTGDISKINENLQIAFQKCGIVKYDAFNEMGGKLSFALTLLDKKNNGFVINAMHSREGCYTYIKEIINGESFIALGEEEQQSLNRAMGKE
ncbi:MAG: DUF4446 family protein [Lachnospiraceae bacterium]|nr:DUF4446 family protein [Lachnospiraceae bacterium]